MVTGSNFEEIPSVLAKKNLKRRMLPERKFSLFQCGLVVQKIWVSHDSEFSVEH